jgi:hypothetical protein
MEAESTSQAGSDNGKSSRAPGAPKGNKNHFKHGLHTYKAMLNGKGLDERTSLFKALREKEQELISALGGDPSPQELCIIADSVKNMLYISSLDNFLMGLRSLVRKSRPHPVLAIRTQLSAHLRENLKTLGLKRRVKESPIKIYEDDDNAADSDETSEGK